MSRLSLPVALAAVVLAAAPAAAFAQTTPATTTPAPAAPAAPSAAPATLSPAVSARVEQHIKALHDQLGITTAEQPQWDQFAQVMRDNAAQIGQAFQARGAKIATDSAADNMQSYAAIAQVHATNMQKLASAFQALYTSFPDAQKQKADTVFRASGGRPPRPHR